MNVGRTLSYRIFLVMLLGGITAVVLGTPANAQPLTGGGTGTITRLDVDIVRDAGGNVTEVRTVEGVVAGAINGTFVETVTGVVHKSGLVTFHGTMTFEGVVSGCGEGTFMVGVTGRAQAGVPTADASFRVIGQPADSLAITGTGSLRQVGAQLSYDVRYTCS